MESEFTKTIEAIKEWERGIALRDLLWEEVVCDDDVQKAVNADYEADQKVKAAFYKDTKDFNSVGGCLATNIGWLKKLVGWPEKGDSK